MLRLRDIKRDMDSNEATIDDIKGRKMLSQGDWMEIE